MSKDEQNKISQYTKDWENAKKKGDKAGMDLAHTKAEAVRNTKRSDDEVGTGDGNTVKKTNANTGSNGKKETNKVATKELASTIAKSTQVEFFGGITPTTPDGKPNPVYFATVVANSLKVDNAVNTVKANDSMIIATSQTLGVPKEMIQAVLAREIYCANPTDTAADLAVKAGIRKDSSTGLGQIFGKTAIDAEKKIYGTSVRDGKTKDEWNLLQDDKNNIFYVGLVLKAKAKELKEQGKISTSDLTQASNRDKQKVLAYYNGTGDKAQAYGTMVMGYNNAFSTYNQKIQ